MNQKVTMILRILLGLAMVVFGLSKFIHFMPMEPPAGDMGVLMGLFMKSPFLKIIGMIEVLGGVALLTNKYVPLALTFLIAVLLNASMFHIFYDEPANMIGAFVLMLIAITLVYAHKDRFKSLLSA